MKKFILGLLVGIILGSVSMGIAAMIKHESRMSTAGSIVGYGNYSNTIIRLKTTSDGTLVIR